LTQTCQAHGPLTFNEESTLWYIGGFIIKSLAEKLLRSKHALKEEMMLTVLEFREDPDAPIAENETTQMF
jgi:hypothetical protein